MNTIYSIREWAVNNKSQIIPWVILALVLMFYVRSCSNHNMEVDVLRQNVAAANDSITRMEINRAGDTVRLRKAFVAELEDLRELNAELADEVEKERGNIKTVTKIEYRRVTEPIYIPTRPEDVQEYTPGKYGIKWEYRDSSGHQYLAGETKFEIDSNQKVIPRETVITKNQYNVTIVTGIKKNDKGEIEVWARTDDPKVQMDIQGAILDPSMFFQPEKNWHIGISGGLGVGSDFKNGVMPGAWVGVTLTYSLFGW